MSSSEFSPQGYQVITELGRNRESVVKFTATRLGEKLTQTVTVENPVPDTVLLGRWEVAPNPQDPPHTPDSHLWIRVEPASFHQNNTVCQILVDTSNLMADKLYKRQLLLHTDAYPETYPITLRVQTAPLPIERRKVPYGGLLSVLLVAVIISWFTSFSIAKAGDVAVAVAGVVAGVVAGAVGVAGAGAVTGAWAVAWAGAWVVVGVVVVAGAGAGVVAGVVAGFWAVGWAMAGAGAGAEDLAGIVSVFRAVAGAVAGAVVGAVVGVMVGAVAGVVPGVVPGKDMSTNVLLTLTAGLGTSIGIGCIIGLLNPYVLLAIALTGLPLATMLLYPLLKRRKLVAKYRQSESRLIKP